MSSESDSEASSFSSSSEDEEDMIILGQYDPYQNEPLAEHSSETTCTNEESSDLDGLTAEVLAARQDKTVTLESWCRCQHCRCNHLVGALEYRCCKEVIHCSGKMVFDGSIEDISCITEHEDYKAMSNKAVLLQVAPLLRDKNGRSYRRRTDVSENEFIRAVAYRWIIRWICGYMGWDNKRPLPSCIYHDIRTKYSTVHKQSRGYRNE